MPEAAAGAPRRTTAPVHRRRGDDGQLLTSRELRERAEETARQRAAEQTAHAAWADGRVCPHRITIALGDLYGPGVDQACGTREPAVDQWEAGTRYPTWEQLKLLADLTGYPVQFFVEPVEHHGGGVMFVCYRSRRNWNPVVEIPEPILHCTPEAIAAAVGGYCLACLDPPPGTRPIHTCEQQQLF